MVKTTAVKLSPRVEVWDVTAVSVDACVMSVVHMLSNVTYVILIGMVNCQDAGQLCMFWAKPKNKKKYENNTEPGIEFFSQ